MTVYELLKSFEENYIRERLRPTTQSGYLTNINNHIIPHLAPVELSELTPDHIDSLTAQLHNEGLSNKSIIYVHATLRKALNFAIKRGELQSNVYALVDLPRSDDYTYVTLDSKGARKLIEAARGKRIYPAVILALNYGLRRGEVLGLRGSDYDPDVGAIRIQRSRNYVKNRVCETPCKTKNGRRLVLLAPEHQRFFRILGPNEYLFKYSQNVLNTEFAKVAKSIGYPGFRFHDLRHTYATLMMKNGVSPKIVSGVLGHSDVSVTLDIYSHPDVESQRVCLETLKKAGL